LFDVTNPGLWMVHCHIAEHMQSGMMFSFTVAANAWATTRVHSSTHWQERSLRRWIGLLADFDHGCTLSGRATRQLWSVSLDQRDG
jgi:hypothetical protein